MIDVLTLKSGSACTMVADLVYCWIALLRKLEVAEPRQRTRLRETKLQYFNAFNSFFKRTKKGYQASTMIDKARMPSRGYTSKGTLGRTRWNPDSP
jgi:hypothetical protein